MAVSCYQHAERTATAFCNACGRALCDDDRREHYGLIYCPECAAAKSRAAAPLSSASANAAGPALEPPLGQPNPGLALALGFIPGVGAIYNGQYLKAVLQVVIFGTLIALQRGPATVVFGLATAAFYFYMVIDSYRVARLMSLGQPVEDFPGLGHIQWRAPIGAIVLLVLGTLLLLENLHLLRGDLFRFLGPAILIFFGVMLLRRPEQR